MTTKKLPKTDVPWANRGWPIVRGCSPVSEGCSHCYAAAWHHRFAKYMGLPSWGHAHFQEQNLEMPVHSHTWERVFVAPMADFYHPDVTVGERAKALNMMERCPRLTFIVLTKRPERIDPETAWPRNVWLGVTAENQDRFDERWPLLLQATPKLYHPLRFVSIEPMLGPVSIKNSPVISHPCELPDWVIAGPETGPHKRLFRDEWIEAVLKESACFFDKREKWIRREWPG